MATPGRCIADKCRECACTALCRASRACWHPTQQNAVSAANEGRFEHADGGGTHDGHTAIGIGRPERAR